LINRPFPPLEGGKQDDFADDGLFETADGSAMTLPFDYRTTLVAEALAPLDRLARQVEAAWGPGRLETLVDPELARRFGQARAELDQAIEGGDPEAVAHFAGAMARGWHAVEQAALAAGRTPEDVGRVWFVEAADRRFALVQDETDVGPVQAKHPGVTCWSVREVARVLASRDLDTVLGIKRAFPGATITGVSGSGSAQPIDWQHGDRLDDIGASGIARAAETAS
jgi:hypothetical protein